MKDRVIPKGLSNKRSQKGIDEVEMQEILPTAEVQEYILYIIPRVTAEYLPPHKAFRKAVHYHIPHAHSQEMTEKSEVVSCQCMKVTVCW